MESISGQESSAIATCENDVFPQSELLAAIVASAQEAVISKTVGGVITSWNPAAEKIYGYSAHEAIGKNISIIVPPENWPHLKLVGNKLAQGDYIAPFETIQVHKDGRRLEVLVSPSAIRNAGGAVIGSATLNTDITGRKRAEEQLKIATEAVRIGSWEWDIRTNQMSWSKILQEMHQLAPGEFQGGFDAFIQNVYPADREGVLQTLREIQRQPGEFHLEYRAAKDGMIWFEARGRVLLDTNGQPERMIGVCMDITQRKAAEEALRNDAALRESEARLRELAEAMPHMVWIANPQGVVTYGNRRYFEYTGAAGQDLISEGGARFIHPEDLPRVTERWREIFRTGAPQEFEFRMLGRWGLYHWHMARMTPIKNEQGKIIRWIGTTTDIDAQKRAAQALKIATRSLERKVEERTSELNQSLQFLEDFLYNMGHHLRAPLRAIVGFTRILMEDNAPAFDAAGRENGQRIVHAATRMDQLLNDLLAFGRISHEEIPCTTVDLDLCVKEVLGRFESEIRGKNATVEVLQPLPLICAHQPTTEIILNNLISNALKFVPPGRPPHVTLWAERKDSFIRLWVADNGLGISTEYQRRVFRPFERLHGYAEYPGTGIGLAIVKKSVQRMGGAVGLSSELGKGSSFWIELPVDQSSLPCPPYYLPSLDFLSEIDALVVTDIVGRIRWVNLAFTRITGHALTDVLGKKPGAFLQGPATDLVEIQKLRDAIRTRKKCSAAVVNYRKNGEPFWFLITLGPIRRNGRYIGFAAVEREISLPISDAQKQELRGKVRRVVTRLRKMPELV